MVRILISDAFNTGTVDAFFAFVLIQNVAICFFETSFSVYVHAYCFVCGILHSDYFCFCFFPSHLSTMQCCPHDAPLLAVTCMLIRLNPIGPLPSCARCLLLKDSVDCQSNEATPRGICRSGTMTFHLLLCM